VLDILCVLSVLAILPAVQKGDFQVVDQYSGKPLSCLRCQGLSGVDCLVRDAIAATGCWKGHSRDPKKQENGGGHVCGIFNTPSLNEHEATISASFCQQMELHVYFQALGIECGRIGREMVDLGDHQPHAATQMH
jgi:hypothetical protein